MFFMPKTVSSPACRQFARRGAALLIPALVMLLAGCSWLKLRDEQVTVPVMSSAADQYRFAVERRAQSNINLVTDPDKIEAGRRIFRRMLEMVPENFPDDRKFTPLAKLDLIEMKAGLDHRKVKVSEKQLREAIVDFEALSADYPEYEFIQAKSLYDRGVCHKMLSQFPEAQEMFRQVRDNFAKNNNEAIVELVKSSTAYYNEVYVN